MGVVPMRRRERERFKGMISRKGLIETTRRYEEELAQRCYGARDVLQSGVGCGRPATKAWRRIWGKMTRSRAWPAAESVEVLFPLPLSSLAAHLDCANTQS